MEQVLIVDDSMVARMAIKSFIKDSGAAIKEAPCGEDAIALLETGFRPDLIFLDLTMPGMGGVETLKEIRRLDSAMKVIVVTADVQEATLAQLQGLEVFEILRKPANKESVLAAFSRANA